MKKTCGKCKITQPTINFSRDRTQGDGFSWSCKTCRSKMEKLLRAKRNRLHKATDFDLDRLKICGRCKEEKPVRDFCRANQTRDGFQSFCKICERERKLNKKYNLTQEEFVAMVESQDGKCLICGRSEGLRLHIDHSHITGKIRGLLCITCNRGIGYLGDSEAICLAASVYLTKAKIVS